MVVETKDPTVMMLQEELDVFLSVCAIIHVGSGALKYQKTGMLFPCTIRQFSSSLSRKNLLSLSSVQLYS